MVLGNYPEKRNLDGRTDGSSNFNIHFVSPIIKIKNKDNTLVQDHETTMDHKDNSCEYKTLIQSSYEIWTDGLTKVWILIYINNNNTYELLWIICLRNIYLNIVMQKWKILKKMKQGQWILKQTLSLYNHTISTTIQKNYKNVTWPIMTTFRMYI